MLGWSRNLHVITPCKSGITCGGLNPVGWCSPVNDCCSKDGRGQQLKSLWELGLTQVKCSNLDLCDIVHNSQTEATCEIMADGKKGSLLSTQAQCVYMVVRM